MTCYDHSAFPGKPVQQGDAREAAIADGLRRLAAQHGLAFKEPLHINSLGEFQLFLVDGQRYGEAFAALLCRHRPRCGTAPTRFLDPLNSWCMMNHFDAAAMLTEAGV